MRADQFAALALAAALGLVAALAQTGRAGAQILEAPAMPAVAYVDDCGLRFLELAPQPEPATLVWGEFGAPFDAAFGVTAFAHGRIGDPRRENAQGLYQCTELVHRYLRQTWGIPTRIGLGLGHGVDLARGLADRFGSETWAGGIASAPVTLTYFANGRSACRPTVGGVVSIAMPYDDGAPSPGHVAVIRALHVESDTVLIATLFEQHGGDSLDPGDEIAPGRIRFERRDGAWTGAFLSQSARTFPVEGWTNVTAAP